MKFGRVYRTLCVASHVAGLFVKYGAVGGVWCSEDYCCGSDVAVDAAAVTVEAGTVRQRNLFMVQNGIFRRGVYGDVWGSPPGCDDVRVAALKLGVANLVTSSQLCRVMGERAVFGSLWPSPADLYKGEDIMRRAE